MTPDLRDFAARMPDDRAKRAMDLVHVPCGERLCDIEHDDTLTTLIEVAAAHQCGP